MWLPETSDKTERYGCLAPRERRTLDSQNVYYV